MKKITWFVMMMISLTCQYVYGYAEDECKQYGGSLLCVEPMPPRIASSWQYGIGNDYMFDEGYPYHTVFKTEESAMYARNVENPGRRIVVNPIGTWLPETCQTILCDRQGKGRHSIMLGTIYFPTMYGGDTAETGTFSSYENFFAISQARALYATMADGSKNFTREDIHRSRKIDPFRCAPNQKVVPFKQISNIPFLCAMPPQPNRCEIQSQNNPIKSTCGNPIDIASGNKTQIETDWQSHNSPLKVIRRYNSLPIEIGMGDGAISDNGWQFQDIQQKLTILIYDLTTTNILYQYNAKQLFKQNSNYVTPFLTRAKIYINRAGQAPQRFYYSSESTNSVKFNIDNIQQKISIDVYPNGSYLYQNDDTGVTETYDNIGRLTKRVYRNGSYLIYEYQQNSNIPNKISDQWGKYIQIQHNQRQITKITLPTGKVLSYTYNSNGKLSQVLRAGFGVRQYVYGETGFTAPNTEKNLLNSLMTGIIDEKGNRYATFSYDIQGRGLSTEHANGTQRYQLEYVDNLTRRVKDPYQNTIKYQLVEKQGVLLPISYDNNAKFIYNKLNHYGNVIEQGQRYGYTNYYDYNERNLEIRKIEIAGVSDYSRITLTECIFL